MVSEAVALIPVPPRTTLLEPTTEFSSPPTITELKDCTVLPEPPIIEES